MRILSAVLYTVSIGVLGYFSVEIKPLDQVQKSKATKVDAPTFARTFIQEKLPATFDKAPSLGQLSEALQQNPTQAFAQWSHAVAIGNIRYFMVKGTAVVTAINEDEVLVTYQEAGKNIPVRLATEFVYGNAIRDAAGIFDIKAFTNTNDINAIAAALNAYVKKEVIAPFKQQLNKGDTIAFVGAIEMNQAHAQVQDFTILPIQLQKR